MRTNNWYDFPISSVTSSQLSPLSTPPRSPTTISISNTSSVPPVGGSNEYNSNKLGNNNSNSNTSSQSLNSISTTSSSTSTSSSVNNNSYNTIYSKQNICPATNLLHPSSYVYESTSSVNSTVGIKSLSSSTLSTPTSSATRYTNYNSNSAIIDHSSGGISGSSVYASHHNNTGSSSTLLQHNSFSSYTLASNSVYSYYQNNYNNNTNCYNTYNNTYKGDNNLSENIAYTNKQVHPNSTTAPINSSYSQIGVVTIQQNKNNSYSSNTNNNNIANSLSSSRNCGSTSLHSSNNTSSIQMHSIQQASSSTPANTSSTQHMQNAHNAQQQQNSSNGANRVTNNSMISSSGHNNPASSSYDNTTNTNTSPHNNTNNLSCSSSPSTAQQQQQYYTTAAQNHYYTQQPNTPQQANTLSSPYHQHHHSTHSFLNAQTVNVSPNTSSYLQQAATTPDNTSNYLTPSQQLAYSTNRYSAFAQQHPGGGGSTNQQQANLYNTYNATTATSGGGGNAGGSGGTSAYHHPQASAYSTLSQMQSTSLQQQQQQTHYSTSYGSSYSSISQLNPSASAYQGATSTASHLDTFGVDTTTLHRGMLSAFRSTSTDQYPNTNTSLQQQLQQQATNAFGANFGYGNASANNQQQGGADGSTVLSNPYGVTGQSNSCLSALNYANLVGGGTGGGVTQVGGSNTSTNSVGGGGSGRNAATHTIMNGGNLGGMLIAGGDNIYYDDGEGRAVGGSGGKKNDVTLGDKMILEKLEKLEAEILDKIKTVSAKIQAGNNSTSLSTISSSSSTSSAVAVSPTYSAVGGGKVILSPTSKKAFMKSEEIKKLTGVGGAIATEGVGGSAIEGGEEVVTTIVENKNADNILGSGGKMLEEVDDYDFPEVIKILGSSTKKCAIKVLAGHGVVGSFFGANGHRVQALQQEYEVTVSVTAKRVHFPGSNNKGVLLFQGRLINILRSLRPLYRAMQEETIRLFLDDACSIKVKPENVKLEVEVVVPEGLRFKMDRNREFRQLMEQTGSNIRVIKQTYEDAYVQERVLVVFGRRIEVEMAIERISLLIQEDVNLKSYQYMKYPDLTVAFNVATLTTGGGSGNNINHDNYHIGGGVMGQGGGGVGGGNVNDRMYLVLRREGEKWNDRSLGGDRGAERGEKVEKNGGGILGSNNNNEGRGDDEKTQKRRTGVNDERRNANDNNKHYERNSGRGNDRNREERGNAMNVNTTRRD